MRTIPVSMRRSLFDPERVTWYVRADEDFRPSVEDMVRGFPGIDAEVFAAFGIVRINQTVVPRESWPYVRPRPDSDCPVAITLHLMPQGPGMGGGGSTGKNTALIIGTIALIAATAWIGGGGLVAAGLFAAGGTFAAGGIGASLAAAGVGLAGALAMQTLAGTPTLPRSKSLSGSPFDNQAAAVGITGNVLRPLQPIPRVLGQVRVSPPHLIRPYTKMVDGKVTAYACVGLAGKTDITDIRFNGIDDATFETVDVNSSETGAAQSLATENVAEQFPGELLSAHVIDPTDDGGRKLDDQATPANSCPKYHYFRTQGIPSKIRMRLLFPGGLFYIGDSTGEVRTGQMGILIEVRKVGDVSWIVLPILQYQSLLQREIRSQITLSWGTASATELTPSSNLYQIQRGAYDSRWGQTANAIYNFGAGTNAKNVARDGHQGWTIHMPTATFPQTAEYEVRIKRTSVGRGSDAAPAGLVSTDACFSFETVAAIDNVPGSDAKDSQILGSSQVLIESFATVRSGNPLVTTGLSYVEIEATEVQIDSISFLATSKVNTWSGSAWGTSGNSNSQNPAALMRHILFDTTLNSQPLTDALLEDADNESLTDWYDYCSSNNLECNYVCEGMSVEEILKIVCACGHASLRRSGTGYGVVVEKDRSAEAIVQIFGPQNSSEHSMRQTFQDPPVDSLFVTYLDETDDFKPKELSVVYTAGGNEQAIEFPGVTLDDRVEEVAQIALRQMALRQRFYQFTVGAEVLLSQRGDLVGYASDFLSGKRFAAWVNAPILNAAGAVLGVTLDRALDIADLAGDLFAAPDVFALADVFAGSQNVGIWIRQNSDGVLLQKQIDTTGLTTSRTLLFSSSIAGVGQAAADARFKGAACIVGILDNEVRRCIVQDIEWQQDMTARVTLVDEAPDIHDF